MQRVSVSMVHRTHRSAFIALKRKSVNRIVQRFQQSCGIVTSSSCTERIHSADKNIRFSKRYFASAINDDNGIGQVKISKVQGDNVGTAETSNEHISIERTSIPDDNMTGIQKDDHDDTTTNKINTETAEAADNAADEDDEDDYMEEMFVQPDITLGTEKVEWGGPRRGGRFEEPTRFGDWERKGRCSDF